MTTTGRLNLPYILQSQKEVTYNEALTMLDILIQSVAVDIGLNTPPGSPAVGDCYIVGNSPTGPWDDKEEHVAQALEGGGWYFVPPFNMQQCWVESEEQYYTYHGSSWVPAGLLMKSAGDYLRVSYLSEDVTVSGASTSTSIEIPDRGLVIAVNVRVITAITGAISFDVGVSGDTGRYGTNIGIALDSTSVGASASPLAGLFCIRWR